MFGSYTVSTALFLSFMASYKFYQTNSVKIRRQFSPCFLHVVVMQHLSQKMQMDESLFTMVYIGIQYIYKFISVSFRLDCVVGNHAY